MKGMKGVSPNKLEERIQWLIQRWEHLRLDELPLDRRYFGQWPRSQQDKARRIIERMKAAGLYSSNTYWLDVSFTRLLQLAKRRIISGETAQRPVIDEQKMLEELADKKFFQNSEMGWVERGYAIQEAIRFYRAVREGQDDT